MDGGGFVVMLLVAQACAPNNWKIISPTAHCLCVMKKFYCEAADILGELQMTLGVCRFFFFSSDKANVRTNYMTDRQMHALIQQ